METERISGTVYRVRAAHTHTLKDGWRLSETTVEATGEKIDFKTMNELMQNAYEEGVEESRRRNRLEKDYNRGVMPG
jgi:hypothetical protein